MKAKVVASIVPRAPMSQVVPTQKLRRAGRWKPKRSRAVVFPVDGKVGTFIGFVSKGSELVVVLLGSESHVQSHLRMRGLDQTALWVLSGSCPRFLDRMLTLLPAGFIFKQEGRP